MKTHLEKLVVFGVLILGVNGFWYATEPKMCANEYKSNQTYSSEEIDRPMKTALKGLFVPMMCFGQVEESPTGRTQVATLQVQRISYESFLSARVFHIIWLNIAVFLVFFLVLDCLNKRALEFKKRFK